jgi:nitrite reductase/ring-hydroxylating ferredoxin subunit
VESVTTWRERPFAPDPGQIVCNVADIAAEGAHEVLFGEGKDAFSLLLLRIGERVVAYRNACPHFGIPLNAEPNRFYCYDDLIMCANHSAMFRIADGFCEDGPCAGASLEPVSIELRDGVIRIG